MPLSSLLNKRLLFVSGKGGVGKTSVSVLLALVAAKNKKRTLIVEMNSTGRVAPIFGTTDVDREQVALSPYIEGINLLPKSCFEEYVLRHVHFKTLYKAFFNNRFVANFVNAIPGLNEVLMLGKIYELERAKKNVLTETPLYDLIIVDAPATGHGLSALEVPQVLAKAVKIGPLHKHANNILELLADKQKTAFCLVTLAEEMPVCESQEYVQSLKQKVKISFGPIFINQVMTGIGAVESPANISGDLKILYDYYNLTRSRSELNQHYVTEIKKIFTDFEQIILPFQFQGLTQSRQFAPLVDQLIGAIA